MNITWNKGAQSFPTAERWYCENGIAVFTIPNSPFYGPERVELWTLSGNVQPRYLEVASALASFYGIPLKEINDSEFIRAWPEMDNLQGHGRGVSPFKRGSEGWILGYEE